MDNNKKRFREVEIDILPIFKALWAKMWLILLVGTLIGSTVFGITKLTVKPTYRSGFTAYVNNNNQHTQGDKDTVSYSDLSAAQQLVNTYIQIIGSNQILSAAAEQVHSDLSYGEINKMVTATVQGETEIIAVYVTSNDPQLSYDLAVAISEVAPKYMTNIVEGSSMKIIDYPVYTPHSFGPVYLKYALFGFLAGALIVIALIVIQFFRDDKIKGEQEIEDRFGLPILGVIPDISSSDSGKGYGYSYAYKHHSDKEKKK